MRGLDWQAHALCSDHPNPDLWYALGQDDQQAAREICSACPVLVQCGEYARRTRQEWGIWGGESPIERLNRRRGRCAASYYSYADGCRCPLCREAMRVYERERYRARKEITA